MEIHRVEFVDAHKVTFQSRHNNPLETPELLEIDHVYCKNKTLCVIESCNLSDCENLSQALDPGIATRKTSDATRLLIETNFHKLFFIHSILSIIRHL